MLRYYIFTFIFFVLCIAPAYGNSYTLEDLVQEPISLGAMLMPSSTMEQGDTSFTIYEGKFSQFSTYFVHGDAYHHILNPNPTGMYINGKTYFFHCNIEKGTQINTSNFLEIYEFEYLSRRYVCLFNFREDCLSQGCLYRCYNVFDVTDPNQVYQYAFSSVYGGSASFGDFNNDGIIDFVRAVPSSPENLSEDIQPSEDHRLLTAYSMQEGKIVPLKSEGSAYYLYVKAADEEMTSFEVLQADWFMPLKDKDGAPIESIAFYPPYISFDPANDFLYDVQGFRTEKKTWVLHVADYYEIDGALAFCEELQEGGAYDIFIMISQYNRNEIKYLVLIGNYNDKNKTITYRDKLAEAGLKTKLARVQDLL
ncbi:MAG: hypothetical protein JJT94_04180 [Bernardetiaceae bacterium]|nr:hypothetical protein [Bernardetiaceae bacterium]